MGIYHEHEENDSSQASFQQEPEQTSTTEVLGRPVPTQQTQDGLRAVQNDKPISPASVQRYLKQKFGDDLSAVTEAMEALARSYSPTQLADQADDLYEKFRPTVPEGEKGWGAKGKLDLELMRSLRHH